MHSFKGISLMAMLLVALCAVYAAEAEGLGGLIASYFDNHRSSHCPAPGQELDLTGEKITIKTMNFPKEPCKAFCSSQGLESLVGNELVTYGPRVICCCAPKSTEQ